MTLTNKLFSLLGFAEPVTLKRFDDCNLLPKNVLLLNINECANVDINRTISQLELTTVAITDDVLPNSIEALIIDASSYSDNGCYQRLYVNVQKSLKLLSKNARILLIAEKAQADQSPQEHAFSQALIGFTKSLAKEVGRKGCTANILLIEKTNELNSLDSINNLINPFTFFLSAKSAFVSGQTLTVDNDLTHITKKPTSKSVAVVTGAAQGIGAAIASKLSNEGYFVIGIDIEPMRESLNNTIKKLNGISFILDVSSDNSGEQLATLAKQHHGFDLVVHNAGITRDKTLAKMPEHYWSQTININLLSVININEKLISEKSINTGGSIVCLSSMNGIAGQGGQTNYACSKAGIIGYVKSMKDTLSHQNITINAVAPGFIETKMTEQVPFFTREMGRRMNALGQGGLPEDVAETIAFLGNKESYAISGQTLRVCGLNIIGA